MDYLPKAFLAAGFCYAANKLIPIVASLLRGNRTEHLRQYLQAVFPEVHAAFNRQLPRYQADFRVAGQFESFYAFFRQYDLPVGQGALIPPYEGDEWRNDELCKVILEGLFQESQSKLFSERTQLAHQEQNRVHIENMQRIEGNFYLQAYNRRQKEEFKQGAAKLDREAQLSTLRMEGDRLASSWRLQLQAAEPILNNALDRQRKQEEHIRKAEAKLAGHEQQLREEQLKASRLAKEDHEVRETFRQAEAAAEERRRKDKERQRQVDIDFQLEAYREKQRQVAMSADFLQTIDDPMVKKAFEVLHQNGLSDQENLKISLQEKGANHPWDSTFKSPDHRDFLDE